MHPNTTSAESKAMRHGIRLCTFSPFWARRLKERRQVNVAAVALVIKHARIIWANRLICVLAGALFTAITATSRADESAIGKLCGFSPQEWSVNLAGSARERRGDPLPFTYWNLLLAVSLMDLADRTKDAALRSYVESIVSRFVNSDGSIAGFPPAGFELLQTIPTGRIFIRVHERTGDERHRKGALLVREAMNAIPRAQGVFAWRPEQVWLDGLWFTLPFYAEYGRHFGENEIFADIRRQYATVVKRSRDPRTGLPHHGWDATHEQFWAHPQTGTSAAIWARAVGWYAMSLVDVLDHVPEGHDARPYLIGLLADIARTVVRYQDRASGLWYEVMDQPEAAGNYLESSASAMFVYVIARGVNRGYLDRRLSQSAAMGYVGLIRDKIEMDAQGRWSLIDIVQSAGLGAPPVWPPGSPPSSRRDSRPRGRDGSLQYYLEQPVVKDHSWGLGAFIRAGLEMQDLMEKTALTGEEVSFTPQRCRSAQTARVQSSKNARSEHEVLETERQWREAWLAADAAALERMHADDYIAIPNIGSTTTKAEVMADVRRGIFRYSRMEHSEQSVRIHADTAIVVGRSSNDGRRGERDVSGDFRYTRIYARRDGRWQAVLSQYTRISAAGK